jgi:hypothetical protein
MILLLSNIPVTVGIKVEELIKKAKLAYGSDYYSVEGDEWFGDNISVDSLLPKWIIKKYQEDPTNVLIVSIIKNYLRWLFSIKYGYGANLEWETIRVPLYMNSIYREALADFYFPGADFSSDPLETYLPNISKFSVTSNIDYFPLKGKPEAIKYLLSTLFGIPWDSVYVSTANSGLLEVAVSASYFDVLIQVDAFLKEYVYPAGIGVIYRSM